MNNSLSCLFLIVKHHTLPSSCIQTRHKNIHLLTMVYVPNFYDYRRFLQNRKRNPGQSIEEFAEVLRNLGSQCRYRPIQLEKSLKFAFITNIRDREISAAGRRLEKDALFEDLVLLAH